MVIGQRHDAGAEPDMAGALGGEGDEDLGRRDDLITGRMVLADPGLLEAELVEVDDQVEITFKALGRILLIGMEGRQEDPVPKVDLAHRGLAVGARAMLSGLPAARNSAASAQCRRSGEGRAPPIRVRDVEEWIPAFAGMMNEGACRRRIPLLHCKT